MKTHCEHCLEFDARGFARGVEAAAKVADEHARHVNHLMANAAANVAFGIRALAPDAAPPTPKETK